jgi:hypothetical protein
MSLFNCPCACELRNAKSLGLGAKRTWRIHSLVFASLFAQSIIQECGGSWPCRCDCLLFLWMGAHVWVITSVVKYGTHSVQVQVYIVPGFPIVPVSYRYMSFHIDNRTLCLGKDIAKRALTLQVLYLPLHHINSVVFESRLDPRF